MAFHLTNIRSFIKVYENKTQNITINSKVTGSLGSIYFDILNQDLNWLKKIFFKILIRE
jgi:hypothetical protein